MSNLCLLFGEIQLKSREKADTLREILERRIYLDCYEYHPKNNTLILDAGFDDLKQIDWIERYVYKKIAVFVPEGAHERLYFKEGQFFSCIYFMHEKFEIVHYDVPPKPSWWKLK